MTTTEFIDDLDGGAAAGTVLFSYEGTDYEIDLSKKNKTAMEKVLRPYLDGGRKVFTKRARRVAPRRSARRSDLVALREWARGQGLEVSERGRVSKEIQEKYDAAH